MVIVSVVEVKAVEEVQEWEENHLHSKQILEEGQQRGALIEILGFSGKLPIFILITL